jgi:hypothetical protein
MHIAFGGAVARPCIETRLLANALRDVAATNSGVTWDFASFFITRGCV